METKAVVNEEICLCKTQSQTGIWNYCQSLQYIRHDTEPGKIGACADTESARKVLDEYGRERELRAIVAVQKTVQLHPADISSELHSISPANDYESIGNLECVVSAPLRKSERIDTNGTEGRKNQTAYGASEAVHFAVAC